LGKPLGWHPRVREAELDGTIYRSRTAVGGTEDPKVRGKPRTKGVEASHKLPRDSMETLEYR